MDFPGTMPLSALDKLKLESAVDQDLRQRLVSDAAGVLAERGIEVPQGVTVNVVEDSFESHTIVLPAYVGGDTSADALTSQTAQASTWECTTCTPTSPICAGSLASLICLGQK